MPSLVSITGLHKSYHMGHETFPAVRGVNLTVEAGEFVAIMGASGSGKTTLMHLVGGLDLPDTGEIIIDGNSITRMSDRARTLFRRRRLGIIFQAYNLMPNLTALENVMLPLLVDGASASEARRLADEMIRKVHLQDRVRHRPSAMSGGEQQRVAIARSLMNKPALILADEPTGNLDPTSSVEVWQLLRDLARDTGTTILMVTHEPAAAAQADRVLVLKQGQFTGVIEPKGNGDEALVAARYRELAD
jgi:putative ABC transport system ATP-binding protein